MKTIGVILGSGIKLKSFEKYIHNVINIKSSGVHKKVIKELIFQKNRLIIFQGRSHIYETQDFEQIFYNVNYAKENNVKLMIITNASGAINPFFKVSDLMLMNSHINFMGKFLKNWQNITYYDKKLINHIYEIAINNSFDIKKGVYCALLGPTYETRNEIKFLRKIGVDSVGMSTVPEIFLCSKYGIKTIGISIITNLLKEFSTEIIDHSIVINSASKSSKKLEKLLELILTHYDN
ncbi:MAG: purine-nucleoside phosphorylase [Ignavibacteria bacterium]|nr:purine-nucleoside phosphorylase [Ignavibacteria bacterium]